nr:helix-hairpin-helix domain-containing protein [Saprospiraceae bacterium]
MNFKHFVYFHPRERLSIVALLVMIFIYCFGEKKIIHLLMENPVETSIHTRLKQEVREEPSQCYDINKVEKSELMVLGLNESVAERWVNYRQAVEGFTSLSQIDKIYGLSENTMNKIIPYLTIVVDDQPKGKGDSNSGTKDIHTREATIAHKKEPEEAKNQAKPEKGSAIPAEKKAIEPFCINSADAEEFRVIRGIGTVLSTRIVRYRELLGGFHSAEQLKEVYGIEDELITTNLSLFIIENTELELIDWRDVEFKEILSHPYTEYEEVICIVNKDRNRSSREDIRDCFKPEVWERLKPYLME